MDTVLISFTDFAEDLTAERIVLSVEELARADRFIRDADRRAFIISHAELRRVLAKYIDEKPVDLQFGADEHGKPFLMSYPNLHFNLSHSGDYALIGVSEIGPIGVDIEYHDEKPNFLAITERFFTQDECSYIRSVSADEQRKAFYDVWTRKEAYVKAIGRGLAYGLDRFSVATLAGLVEQIDGWCIRSLDVPGSYSVSMVSYEGAL